MSLDVLTDDEKFFAKESWIEAIKMVRTRLNLPLTVAKGIVWEYLKSIGRVKKVKVTCEHCHGEGVVETEEVDDEG